MKNLKTVVFTLAIITLATISSYAQTKADVKTEKFMFVFRGGDTTPKLPMIQKKLRNTFNHGLLGCKVLVRKEFL